MLAQGVEQRGARVEHQAVRLAVDVQRHGHGWRGLRRQCFGAAPPTATAVAAAMAGTDADAAPAFSRPRREIVNQSGWVMSLSLLRGMQPFVW